MTLLRRNISLSQCKDAGLALVLLSLLLALATKRQVFLLSGIGFLVVTMTAPVLFRPFAKIWFGFSHALGTVVSKILLAVLFFLLVLPVGFARRAAGKDALQLKGWKNGKDSVFHDRDHLFTRQDLNHPY
jgi:multisubunit Na+/H+ antiporter MnhG subunit